MKLDPIDLKIVAALQRDGRMTKLKLAETVALSGAACWERLRRMEAANVIKGYRSGRAGAGSAATQPELSPCL